MLLPTNLSTTVDWLFIIIWRQTDRTCFCSSSKNQHGFKKRLTKNLLKITKSYYNGKQHRKKIRITKYFIKWNEKHHNQQQGFKRSRLLRFWMRGNFGFEGIITTKFITVRDMFTINVRACLRIWYISSKRLQDQKLKLWKSD